MKSKTIANKMV